MAAAGLMAGMAKAGEGRKLLRLLGEADSALAIMEAEIEQRCRPLPDIFGELAVCGPEGLRGFFALLKLEDGECPLEEVWDAAVHRLFHDGESLRLLCSLGGILGRFDARQQAGELRRVRLGLSARAEGLRREMEQRGKNYPALGLCAGAAMAILLI